VHIVDTFALVFGIICAVLAVVFAGLSIVTTIGATKGEPPKVGMPAWWHAGMALITGTHGVRLCARAFGASQQSAVVHELLTVETVLVCALLICSALFLRKRMDLNQKARRESYVQQNNPKSTPRRRKRR
jgi:hypothetical protein